MVTVTLVPWPFGLDCSDIAAFARYQDLRRHQMFWQYTFNWRMEAVNNAQMYFNRANNPGGEGLLLITWVFKYHWSICPSSFCEYQEKLRVFQLSGGCYLILDGPQVSLYCQVGLIPMECHTNWGLFYFFLPAVSSLKYTTDGCTG